MKKELQNIPAGWSTGSFEDLLDYIQPTEYIVKSTEYNDKYKTPVLTPGKSFIKGYTNESSGIFNSLPVIIFDDFTTANKFVNFPFKVKSSAMKILKPKNSNTNIKFAYYLMQTVRINNDTHKRYWISVFSKIKFPLPPPTVQDVIVSKIEELFSELDKGIENLKTAQQQLKTYRQSVLKWAFEGKLTPSSPALLPKEKGALSPSPDGRGIKGEGKEAELPKGWKVVKLDEILSLSKEKHVPTRPENLFYIGLEHIEKHTGRLTSLVGKEIIKTLKNKFSKGDILYGKLRPNLNKVYLANESGVCSTDILVLKLSKDCLAKYLHPIMLSTKFVNEMSENTSGVNLPRVSTKFILNYHIPLPPITEQNQIIQEIESRLSVADKMEENINQSIQQADALRQSILKKAFEGRLVQPPSPLAPLPEGEGNAPFSQGRRVGDEGKKSKKHNA